MRLIIYKDYDLIEEINKILSINFNTYEIENREMRKKLREFIEIIEKSVELIIENENNI